MEIKVKLNGKNVIGNVEADTVLLDWLREKGCLSVKRGCDTSNCGLCTVFMDNKPILSCSKLAVQADGHEIKTLEGLQEEALEFVGFIADQGADQCGNLCRCSGYEGQLRGIRNFLDSRKACAYEKNSN